MKCLKCFGKMIEEEFTDPRDDMGVMIFRGWRCLFCGEIVDPVILFNRVHRPVPVPARNRRIMGFR